MDIVLRSAVIFVFVMVVVRLLGRRELSKMEPFDLLILVVIADFVQQGVTQQDYSVTGAVLAVGTFGLLIVATSWLAWRFPRTRPFLDGNPVVLVEDGKPIMDNLRRERISVEELARSGTAAADRVHEHGPLGDSRDQRRHQLHI